MQPIRRPTVAFLALLLTGCGAAGETPSEHATPDATAGSSATLTALPTASPPEGANEPDATGRLAYLRNLELILLDVATGAETATGIVGLTPIAFTADGRSLIAYRTIPDNPHALGLVRQPLDGAAASVLADAVSYGSARSSPDDGRLAFATERGVLLVSLDHGEASQLTTGSASSLVWSPDGAYVAVEQGRPQLTGTDLHVVDVATGATLQLTNDEWEDSPFAWADDGSAVLTTSHRGGDGTKLAVNVWQVDVPSGELSRRTNSEVIISYEFPSPDGRMTARVSDTGRLSIFDPARSRWGRIDSVDSSVHLTWSPNGAWLVWSKFTAPGESDLFMVHAPDGEPIQLTSTPGTESHPVWGPISHDV